MTRKTAQRAAELVHQIELADESIRVVNHPKTEMSICVSLDTWAEDLPDEECEDVHLCLGDDLSTEARAEIASIIIRDLSAQRALAETELLKL